MDRLDLETLGWFIAVLFPGFVTLKVYSLLIPSVTRQSKEIIVDLLAYGTMNAALNVPLYILVRPFIPESSWVEALAIGTALVAVPTAMGFMFAQVRKSGLLSGLGVLHPVPRAWDQYFGQKRSAFAIVTFKDGDKIGGFFGPNSLASSFPHEEEMYIERVCKVDPETGEFIRFVPNSNGVLIRRADCKSIEFLEVK